MREVGSQARELADAAANLFVLGAREGRAGKVIAQLTGHAKVDTTLNVYAQVVDAHCAGPPTWSDPNCSQTGRNERANSLKNWLLRLDSNQQPSG